jgi:hypothetical protein
MPLPGAEHKTMVERAQVTVHTDVPLTSNELNPAGNASREYSPSVGDQSTNNYWHSMTGNRSFSDPRLHQMLNDGFMLVADNKKERGSGIHDWIRKTTKDTQDTIKQKLVLHEVSNDAQEVVSDLKAILNDPNRNKGEFSWAIGTKGGKLYGSSASFTPSEGKSIDGSEIHGSADLAKMELGEYQITAVIHTHPDQKDMDTNNFSSEDISQADELQGMYGGSVKSYLLTPDNHLLVYSPKHKKEHPKGEQIGFFLKSGQFICTNDRYKEFKSTR